jgi:hypothetical protein
MRQHALVLLLLPTAALAVPTELDHQGRLLDAVGTPLQGEQQLHFALYADATLGSPVWEETHQLTVQDGYYHQRLGGITPLDSQLFTGGTLYLGLTANNGAETAPRTSLVSVPFAIRAADADHADVASALSPDAALDIASVQTSGDIRYDGIVQHGSYDQRYDYPFYRLSTNQLGNLSGTGRVSWSNNTGVRWYTYRTLVTGTPFASRDAEEQQIMTAMGMGGKQHFQPNVIVTRVEWDSALQWVSFPTQIWAPGTVTYGSYCKSLTGAVLTGYWATGMNTEWGLCGSHGGPYSPGSYIHAHPGSSGAGSALVIWPAVIAGNFPLDHANPMWGYWPYQPL